MLNLEELFKKQIEGNIVVYGMYTIKNNKVSLILYKAIRNSKTFDKLIYVRMISKIPCFCENKETKELLC